MPAEYLAHSVDLSFAMQTPLEFDRHLVGELPGGVLDRDQIVDYDVRLAPATIDASLDQADRLGRHEFAETRVIFGPHDAPHRSADVLEVEVGVFCVTVAARLF